MSGIDRVALRVADLDRTVGFYERVVGLDVLDRTDGRATLGVDDPLLVVLGSPDAPARGPSEAGLFHTAFRVPSRAALGDVLDRVDAEWDLDGASDHGVSEALYFTDPADNGVEVYRDRPRAEWPWTEDGGVAMDTRPLALDPLRDAAAGNAGCPAGTDVGHVHLEATSLPAARAFYVDRVGLRVRQSIRGAHFLAVDDYHHHVGVNVWNGRSAPHDPSHRGLAWVELDANGEGEVTDPDGIRVRLG